MVWVGFGLQLEQSVNGDREREAGREKEKKGIRGERSGDFFINISVC
jgi:hypothetical protein